MEYCGYLIKMNGYGLREICPEGRGTVPNALRGMFTNAVLAQKAIDDYQESKPKGKVDGKAEGKE